MVKEDKKLQLLNQSSYFLSTKKNIINSKILQPGEVELLKKWSGIKKNKKFNLKLLYRATKDGSFDSIFYEKCEAKKNCFILIKTNHF